MTSSEKNGAYDVARCREVWKRVCPAEDPYPDADAGSAAQDADLSLPGAQADPCCMGTDAVLTVEVLQGFLREELGDAQVYAYLSSCTPRREMARAFRALSEDEKRHARDLAAAIYLITGKAYCPRVCVEQPDTCDICALLRQLYHAEACGGYNYARAGVSGRAVAMEASDVCAHVHADDIALLEHSRTRDTMDDLVVDGHAHTGGIAVVIQKRRLGALRTNEMEHCFVNFSGCYAGLYHFPC